MEFINRDKILKECACDIENDKNENNLIDFVDRVVNIINVAYNKGYEAGKKEVKNIDR